MFGEVTKGMEIIKKVESLETNDHDRPEIPVVIVECGELVTEE